MKYKIIQKGTGYYIGEIDGENLFIDTTICSDEIIEAVIVKTDKLISEDIKEENI